MSVMLIKQSSTRDRGGGLCRYAGDSVHALIARVDQERNIISAHSIQSARQSLEAIIMYGQVINTRLAVETLLLPELSLTSASAPPGFSRLLQSIIKHHRHHVHVMQAIPFGQSKDCITNSVDQI